jgi:NTE family protein/lysophospholipid hydrolase
MTEHQAEQLLQRVEMRTAYLIAQSRRALKALLSERPPQGDPFDFYAAIKLTAEKAFQPDISDLERFIEAWGRLIPTDPAMRAEFARALGRKYTFTPQAVRDIRDALGFDTPAIQNAFERLYDQPFDSIYSDTTEADITGEWIGAIGGMSAGEVRAVESQIDWIQLVWGEELFQQGEEGDNMYVLVNGRVRITRTREDGTQQHIRDVGPGAIIGEVALLTDEPRTATAFALRDTELIRLTRAGLQHIMETNPAIMARLTREMVRRLDANRRGVQQLSRVKVIALLPTSARVPIADVAARLAKALERFGPVMTVDAANYMHVQGQVMVEGVNTMQQINWMENIEAEYRFVIYQAEHEPTAWTKRCLGHADRILVVGRAEGSPQRGEAEATLYTDRVQRIATMQELVLLHPSRQADPTNTAAWLAERPAIFRHHHVALTHPPDFERLARFISGQAVGLALGGGGARGLAHLGVLRAFDEMDIPVDVIGGVSFGAIVAGAYAAGYTIDEMTDLFRNLSQGFRRYMDVTLPFVSVVAGRRLNTVLRKYYGDEQEIEDLWLRCYTVSANLNQGGPRVHDRGKLWRAVRASVSIPVLFPPVLYDGELHTDGGAFTNMPADITLEMLGRGTVIGSSVTPKDEIRTRFNYQDSVSGLDVLRSRFQNLPIKVPGAVDVLVWAMGLSNSYLRPKQDAAADIMLNLPVDHYELFDFKAFDDLVEAGYNTTKQALSGWNPYNA